MVLAGAAFGIITLFPAATRPDQVSAAAAYVAQSGTAGVGDQGWDASVAAVARYKEAITLLGGDDAVGEWTCYSREARRRDGLK
jgi:hypothetical protein